MWGLGISTFEGLGFRDLGISGLRVLALGI